MKICNYMVVSDTLSVSIPTDYPPSKAYNPSTLIEQSRKILQVIDSKSEASDILGILAVASHCYTYMQDTSTPPPLDGKRFQAIKKDFFLFIREKATLNGLFRMIAQTILLTQSYKNFYELITKSGAPIVFPYSKILIFLSNIFLIQEEFCRQVSQWRSYEKGDQNWESLIKMTRSVVLMSLQISQFVVFLPPFQMFGVLQVALSTLLYGLTIYDLFLKESEEIFDLKKAMETPPEVLL